MTAALSSHLHTESTASAVRHLPVAAEMLCGPFGSIPLVTADENTGPPGREEPRF